MKLLNLSSSISAENLCLLFPDLSKPFDVQCDASGECVGAVLNQEGHAIAYESKRLQGAEKTASTYEKELMAVIHALKMWKHYLMGSEFTIRTAQQSLRFFLSQPKMSEKQLRWANYLAQFHFTIMHTPGTQNKVADSLSRRPQIHAISTAYHIDLTTLRDLYATDEDFQIIWSKLPHGDLVPSYVIKEGFLFMQHKLCVTKELRTKVMEECHVPPFMGHRGILVTPQAMESHFFWPSMRKDVEKSVSECLTCQKVKFDRHKPAGLLQPMPIPNIPWKALQMTLSLVSQNQRMDMMEYGP